MSETAQPTRAQPKADGKLAEFAELEFEDTFVRELPGDPVQANVPRQVRLAAYTRVDPTPVREPRLLAWSDDVARMLGISRPSSAIGVEA